MRTEMGKFEIPKARNQKNGKILGPLNNFIENDSPMLKFSFDSKAEAMSGDSCVRMYLKGHKLEKHFRIMRRGFEVYVVRRIEDADTQN